MHDTWTVSYPLRSSIPYDMKFLRHVKCALLPRNRKEVLAVSMTQAQATRKQAQEELLLADAKRTSCACIIFGLYCNMM